MKKKIYRLSTEAEWEYACRAGMSDKFFHQRINPWGLRELSDTLYDWCQDWFGDYPSVKIVDPTGHTSGEYRVIRRWSDRWGCESGCRDNLTSFCVVFLDYQ